MKDDHTQIVTPIQVSDLYTIDGLVAQNPQVLNKTMLRWQLRHRKENGLSFCCVRGGKNILISKSRYEHWLSSQTGI